MVKDFYTNARRLGDDPIENYMSYVIGHTIRYDPDSINRFLNTEWVEAFPVFKIGQLLEAERGSGVKKCLVKVLHSRVREASEMCKRSYSNVHRLPAQDVSRGKCALDEGDAWFECVSCGKYGPRLECAPHVHG
ncbi:hypothetical protein LR48_Vigan08g052600 [Vigna angularis]|uniref:Uncharacterized protein n=1 Tax=Phaseolus angularis TaxID=3914 RepID=A0A0L9V4P6_PHAAN|nr:hypothetical protein LR48_Vigan08g052600 [Vigna angularis]